MQKHDQRSHTSREQPCGSGAWLRTSVISSAALALALTAAPASWAQEEPEWSELRALIEINATDGDAGLQFKIDGDDWVSAIIRDPNGKKIYSVQGGGSVSEQGLTENFFESAEPSCDEEGASLTDVLTRFPAGAYEITGRSTENDFLGGEAVLTHALPAVPVSLVATNDNSVTLNWVWPAEENEDPDLGECPDEDDIADLLVDDEDLFGFQIVVIREDPEPQLEFIVELGPTAIDVNIPDGFIEPNTEYKWEVVAIGAGVDPEDPNAELDPELKGNQTIAESSFCTDGNGVAGDCAE